MAIADKALRAIAEYGDDVVRAASEFGDDAVESILRLSPDMRSRLAAVAERQRGVATKQASKYGKNKSTRDITQAVADKVSSLFANVDQTGNVGATPNVIQVAQRTGSALGDTRETRERLAELATRLSFKNTTRRPDELEVLSQLEGTKKSAAELLADIREDVAGLDENLPYVVGRINPAKDFAEEAARNYEDAVIGITRGRLPNRFTEINSRLNDLAPVLTNNIQRIGTLGPEDLVPAINQLRLQALLRMIGDAQ